MMGIQKPFSAAALYLLFCAAGPALFAPAYGELGGLSDGSPTHGTTTDACPINVEISVAADSCTIGENFIITCRFTNITNETVRLHATDLDLLVDPLWVRIDDGPVKRGHRIGLHSAKEPPGPEDVIEFGPGEALATKVFFLQGETLPSFLSDPSVLDVRAGVGPVMVYGDSKNVWTLTTNAIRISVRAPDKQDMNAFNELESILTARTERGMSSYLVGLEEWLTVHRDSPLAPRVHYELVQGWSARLDALKREEREPPSALFASVRFCLERGTPYSNIVGRNYLEFLYAQKQWKLVELAARCIQQHTKISRLSDRAESYLGTWGALLDTSAFTGIDDTQKDRLRVPLLQCLRRSLESGNPHAVGMVPRLLKRLEKSENWRLLEQVALWAQRGCSSKVDVRPYLEKAREHLVSERDK